MSFLPRIYKTSSTGKVIEWEIEIEGNRFRTISGQEYGKKVVTKWKECAGKNIGKANETSPEDQAIKEALAKRQRKLDREFYVESLQELKTKKFIKPMLAKKFADYEHELDYKDGVYLSIKLNGVRCIATKDKLLSRKGQEYIACPHIRRALQDIFLKYPDIILDGELFNEEYRQDLGSIVSLISKKDPCEEDLKLSSDMIQYHIYDIVDTNTKYLDRLEKVRNIVKEANSSSIKLVEAVPVKSLGVINSILEHYENKGHEGVIIRRNEKYENKRSKFLLKHKSFIDEEFTITGVIEGEGNLVGMVGSLTFNAKNGEEFAACPTGSHEYWAKMWQDRQRLIGKNATVRYKDITQETERGGGVPTFGKIVAIRDYE